MRAIETRFDKGYQVMSECVPVDKVYSSRKEARSALEVGVMKAFGHTLRLDSNLSSKTRAVFRCSGVIETIGRGRTMWKAYGLENFSCDPRPNEGKMKFRRRKNAELEKFAQGKICSFKAIADKISKQQWQLRVLDDGKNYIPPSKPPICKLCLTAKMTGKVMRKLARTTVTANPSISQKDLAKALGSSNNFMTEQNLPAARTMYRVMLDIRHDSDKYYDVNWERLERYIIDLQAQNNESVHAVVEKDHEQRFLRYFIGLKVNVDILEYAGLDSYSIDACHTKHHIAKGMQLHYVMGRNGNNQNVQLAWSLEASETSKSYEWLAAQCQACGMNKLFNVDPGHLKRTPVCHSDGFKGTVEFPEKFPRLKHALCVKHIARAIRHSLLLQKRKDPQIEVGFSDNQIIAVAKASNEKERSIALQRLKGTSKHAAQNLVQRDFNKFCLLELGKQNIATWGHVTSNVVEGMNGVDANSGLRAMHPLRFLDEKLQNVAEKQSEHLKQILKQCGEGKKLNAFATEKLRESFELTKNGGYTSKESAGGVLVWDILSRDKIRHRVIIDKDKPCCSPCYIWEHFRLPCPHMLLALGKMCPEMLTPEKNDEFLSAYFHPAYLVKNLKKGYEIAKSKPLILPNVAFGPKVQDASEIVDLTDATSDATSNATSDAGAAGAASPFSSGAPGYSDIDSDTSDVAQPMPPQPMPPQPMLPPLKWSLEKYRLNIPKGRRKKKRIRSNGEAIGRNNRQKVVARSASLPNLGFQDARNVVNEFDFSAL